MNMLDFTVYCDSGPPADIFATDSGGKSGLENSATWLLHYFQS